jgi:hypothetical protein
MLIHWSIYRLKDCIRAEKERDMRVELSLQQSMVKNVLLNALKIYNKQKA